MLTSTRLRCWGKEEGYSTARFEQVCIYISGLTQLTATEAISNVRGKESHTATCPVPYCYICGTSVGKQGETASLSGGAQSYWSHIDNCMQQKMYTAVGNKYYLPLQTPGDYHPNMDHVELIEAQLTREGMLAYESIAEASMAGFQEMTLYKRREYFDALILRYNPSALAKEKGVVNFSYPLMHMIATGQLFEPYLHHPNASGDDRRQESEYCLDRLAQWVNLFKWNDNPVNIEMDWEGAWLDSDFVSKWNRNYVIPDVEPEMKPEYHPTSYHVQPNAVRMILPAKGMLPVGSYIGSPGFGLIHPTTITAAVLQNAGFQYDEHNPESPMRFDAISLAPNFDIPTGKYRMLGVAGMITDWELCDCPEEVCLVCIPPEDLSFDDLINFKHVPIPLVQRESMDKKLHEEAFGIAYRHSEDQLLAFHMAPMLSDMGTNVRAILYQHALSRAGLDTNPLRDTLTNLEPVINQVIDHSWLSKVDYEQIKEYIGDHPSLAENYPVRRFRQLLWDVVGCEAALGDWQKFTSEEQRLIVYASFYGLQAPERVPYQKGFRLVDEDHQVILPDIDFEYHSQYVTQNCYKLSGEEGEPEPVITPPSPTAPELEDPLVFDPKVTGISDHLIGLMTDEQKAQLKEQAKSEGVTPSYRHVTSTPREVSPRSESPQSRGPSRSHPLYLGRIAVAAHKANTFPNFQDVQNTILPCGEKEAVALFSSPPWIQRVTACTTPEEVMEVFRLYHQQCWSEKDKGVIDPIIWTDHWKARYKKIRRRLKYLDKFVAQYKHYPAEFEEEDDFSSEDEPPRVTEGPVLPRHRPVIPGDFVLTFNLLVLANSLESQFPYRSEYWWTLLPGTLDQACMCFSMQQWVNELKTCKDEESFVTTYQSFIDTTWEAFEERLQITDTFPYVRPTPDEVLKAYYMKNRALILHNRLVWGPEADKDRPVVPTTQEEAKSKPSQEDVKAVSEVSYVLPIRGDGDDDDPNKRKPDETPPIKGDESQDPKRKEEEKEASAQDQPKSSAEKEAQDKIDRLMQQLQEAREAKAQAEKEAQEAKDAAKQAAEEKARKTGEELAQQVDDEEAKKVRKREKKREKKKKKSSAATEADKPEGEKDTDKKPEEDERPKDKPEGEGQEGPPKDEEPAESWIEVIRRAAKP